MKTQSVSFLGAFLALLLSLQSCVVPKKYQQGTISRATISSVEVPSEMMYPDTIGAKSINPGKALLGAVLTGAVLGATTPYTPAGSYAIGQSIGGSHAKHQPNVRRDESTSNYFRSELTKKLHHYINQAGEFRLVNASDAEARITIDTFQWGLGMSSTPFNHKIFPTCWVTVEMKDLKNKLLWRKEIIHPKSGALSSSATLRTPEEYKNNDALLLQDLTRLADEVAQKIADNIVPEKCSSKDRRQ